MSGEEFDAFGMVGGDMGGMQMQNQEDAFADAGIPGMDSGMGFG